MSDPSFESNDVVDLGALLLRFVRDAALGIAESIPDQVTRERAVAEVRSLTAPEVAVVMTGRGDRVEEKKPYAHAAIAQVQRFMDENPLF